MGPGVIARVFANVAVAFTLLNAAHEAAMVLSFVVYESRNLTKPAVVDVAIPGLLLM